MIDPSDVPDYPARLEMQGTGVVILGAGQGIGRQASHAFHQAGARCICVDLEQDLADQIASEVGGIGLVGDMTVRSDVERVFREAELQPGGFGAVVDIIGVGMFKPLVEMSDADLSWQYDIVLGHAILALQVASPLLVARGGGAITFVSSISGGTTGAPGHAAYGAMKAALGSLVRSTALELGGSGIRVNAVAPGAVETPRISQLLGAAGIARNSSVSPLGRMAVPADVAGVLLFLTSDLASFITGQTILVDGGASVTYPYPPPR